jgi:hypothetical protein
MPKNLSAIFASLFEERQAQDLLGHLGGREHTDLPTFTLTTTSLRHLTRWFDRLDDINRGVVRAHGNYYSDPAALGLVNDRVSPPRLSQAGRIFLELKPFLYDSPARAEFELLRLLYFSGPRQPRRVTQLLKRKADHLNAVLSDFSPSGSREAFLEEPSLLAIVELIGGFTGAVRRFSALPPTTLARFALLGEGGFANLCPAARFGAGLARLCRRIGSDYHRAQERRLNTIVAMALLIMGRGLPGDYAVPLVIPAPIRNILAEQDLHALYGQFTSELVIWHDGERFLVSRALGRPILGSERPEEITGVVSVRPPSGRPPWRGRSAGGGVVGGRRRGAETFRISITDPIAAERAEDFVERALLLPEYGERLVRVGHRQAEVMPLADGMLPGADFYVLDVGDKPIIFVEVKSTSGGPPADISLTRAEYLRARFSFAEGKAYRLILVDLENAKSYEVEGFASWVSTATLDTVRAMVVTVG